MADVGTLPASTAVPFSHSAAQHQITPVTKTQPSKDPEIARSVSTRSTPRRAPDAAANRRSVASSSFALSRAGSRASRASRMTTATQPLFSSSLDYTSVRDFAYKREEPAHYGIPLPASGATTPASEYHGNGRRLSDPIEALFRGGASGGIGKFSAGAWGGDGVLWGEPGSTSSTFDDDLHVDPLPATSFAGAGDWNAGYVGGGEHDSSTSRKGKHRKSRSYADISDFERERSGGSANAARRRSHRRSREQYDPAGREGLRLSRGFADVSSSSDRRDSHFARTNGGGGLAAPGGGVILPAAYHSSHDPDTRMPLDEEYNGHSFATGHHHNSREAHHEDYKDSHMPQRDSLSPEDESVRGQALALYDFEPENPNELHLSEGQIVNVAYRNGHGWLVAEDPTSGEQGLVPEAYVRLVRDIEGWDEEKGGFFEEEEDEDDAEMSEDVESHNDEDDETQPGGHESESRNRALDIKSQMGDDHAVKSSRTSDEQRLAVDQ